MNYDLKLWITLAITINMFTISMFDLELGLIVGAILIGIPTITAKVLRW